MTTYTVRPGATSSTGEYVPETAETGSQGAPIRVGKSEGRRTQSVFVPLLAALSVRITSLLEWPEEWDGYQVAPTRDAVEHAFEWIKGLYEDVSAESGEWLDPLIVADAHRNVVFEWLKGHKRLIVYIGPEAVEYLEASGPDIWSDMEDGEIQTPEERLDLWHRLVGRP